MKKIIALLVVVLSSIQANGIKDRLKKIAGPKKKSSAMMKGAKVVGAAIGIYIIYRGACVYYSYKKEEKVQKIFNSINTNGLEDDLKEDRSILRESFMIIKKKRKKVNDLAEFYDIKAANDLIRKIFKERFKGSWFGWYKKLDLEGITSDQLRVLEHNYMVLTFEMDKRRKELDEGGDGNCFGLDNETLKILFTNLGLKSFYVASFLEKELKKRRNE